MLRCFLALSGAELISSIMPESFVSAENMLKMYLRSGIAEWR